MQKLYRGFAFIQYVSGLEAFFPMDGSSGNKRNRASYRAGKSKIAGTVRIKPATDSADALSDTEMLSVCDSVVQRRSKKPSGWGLT